MLGLAKAAGEADALSSFGLAHGTPLPPPSWAQRWLSESSKHGTKKVTIPSMSQGSLKKDAPRTSDR
jgi:hypothetical protein